MWVRTKQEGKCGEKINQTDGFEQYSHMKKLRFYQWKFGFVNGNIWWLKHIKTWFDHSGLVSTFRWNPEKTQGFSSLSRMFSMFFPVKSGHGDPAEAAGAEAAEAGLKTCVELT